MEQCLGNFRGTKKTTHMDALFAIQLRHGVPTLTNPIAMVHFNEVNQEVQ
jgi:hypothetical protein